MKHLKTYENKTNNFKKGDFVYVELDDKTYKPSSFIGVFVRGRSRGRGRGRGRSKYPYLIRYDGTYYPYIKQYEHIERLVKESEVIAFSENIENLDVYINSNKYNL